MTSSAPKRLAVVPGDAGAQLDLVLGGVAVGVPLEREPGAGGEVGVDEHQRVVEVLDPALVDRRDADQRVQRLGGAAADEAGAQRAALDGRAADDPEVLALRAGAAAAGGGQQGRSGQHRAGGAAKQVARETVGSQPVVVPVGRCVLLVGHRILQGARSRGVLRGHSRRARGRQRVANATFACAVGGRRAPADDGSSGAAGVPISPSERTSGKRGMLSYRIWGCRPLLLSGKDFDVQGTRWPRISASRKGRW